MSKTAPATAPASNPNTLELSRPIMTDRGELKTLTFREATGSDYLAIGAPVTYDFSEDGDPRPQINEKIALKYVPLLCDINDSALKQMRPRDLMLAAQMAAAVVMADADPN